MTIKTEGYGRSLLSTAALICAERIGRSALRLSATAMLASTLVLAGCGGGSDDMSTDDMTTMPDPDPAIAERAAINTAIMGASTAVAGLTDDASDTAIGAAETAVMAAKQAVMDAANVSDDEKAAHNTTIATIEGQLSTKKASIMAARDEAADAMKAAMAKTGKALHAALGPPATDTTPATYALANIAAPSLTSAGLAIDAASGAGALADGTGGTTAVEPDPVTLKAGDSAGSLGSWKGKAYAHTDSDTKIVNEARVYTNQGPAKSVSFADAGHTVITTDGADKGYLAVNGTVAEEVARVMSAAFTHSGTQNHPIPARSNAFYVRGTYDGAPGEYRCTGTCTSTNDGKGSPSALAGTWHFKPDAGAMVSQPDGHYLYYGWWVSKDKDGAPTAASAFAGRFGNEADVSTDGLDPSEAGTAISGSATYVGNAAGKFAMNNVLDGTGNGGHFTADATLTAKFGDPSGTPAVADAGMTGTIDNFRLNDGSEDPGWSVSLARGAWGATGAITAPTTNPTVWSINGNKAPASGTWSGQMYDEMPGTAPGGDGSNIPTTVTGTFYSEFSTIGRMAGGFGADKQ